MLRAWAGRLAVCALLEALAIFVPAGRAAAAPPTADERVLARTAETALRKGANLYRAKKYAAAAEAFGDAQKSLDQLAAKDSREVRALAAPLERQLSRLREQLEAQGAKLPAEKRPAEKSDASGEDGTKPAGKKPPAKPAKPMSVSFTRQIAPLLVAKCGGCHVERNRGELSMATYVALGRGSASGSVIMPGDAQGSRIVEVIMSGEMPRGGGAKVAPDELTLLVAWINAGAKFDGPDSAAPIKSFGQNMPTASDSPPKLPVVKAGADDAVLYARDVAPIFAANCLECHGERNPRNNFSLDTFERLLRGGDSGAVVAPGDPAESLLVKKLRGTAGARMPMNRPPLAAAEIDKIEKWIALGGKFDGSDAKLPLEETIELALAERSTHEQLMRKREELAAKNWHLILPDAQANHEARPDVLVFGGASPRALAEVAQTAEEQVGKLRKLFKVPADEPFVKGRLTLFVFEKRYDYGEVGTMLEHREIPAVWRGHWHYSPLDAYGCVLLSSEGEASRGLVAQQLAGAYIASLGGVPRWFAEGSARAVAAKLDPKDPRVKLWDEQLARIVTDSEKPDAFLTGGLQPEANDIASYSFVKYLMSSGGRYTALLAALGEGAAFDEAFSRQFGGTPRDRVFAWLAKAPKRGR